MSSEIKINEQKEYFTKEIDTFKKNQIEILELKNSIKEQKNERVTLEKRADQMETPPVALKGEI